MKFTQQNKIRLFDDFKLFFLYTIDADDIIIFLKKYNKNKISNNKFRQMNLVDEFENLKVCRVEFDNSILDPFLA